MKLKHIIFIVAIAVGIAAIVSTYGDSSSYVTFKEAEKTPEKEFHVVGSLVRDREMIYEPEKDANLFTFYAKDTFGTVKKILYNHPKPNDFELSDKVVIVGKNIDQESFQASQILLKCPSKYEGEKKEI